MAGFGSTNLTPQQTPETETLRPSPITFHPSHPSLQTLNPEPCTLNPAPQTPNPELKRGAGMAGFGTTFNVEEPQPDIFEVPQ